MRRIVSIVGLGAVFGAVLGAGGAARAADPQPYAVRIDKTGNAAVDAAISGSSLLESLRTKAPVGPFALISRAQQDEKRFALAEQSEGYYAGSAAVTIEGRAPEDAGLPALLAALPAGQAAQVVVHPVLGPLFHLGQVTIDAGRETLPARARAALGIAPGDPARAQAVLAAGTALLAALQDDGYALARVPPPVAYLKPASRTLDVTYKVVAGKRLEIGTIAITGLKRIRPDFVRRRLLVHQGELYNPDRIEAARQDLASLPVFASVRVTAADHADAAGQLPLDFALTERLRHVVALNAAYSTDLGASAGASWTDRNLLGRAEQLTVSAAVTELGGSDASQPGYNLTVSFLKPDWLRRDQSIQLDAIAVREYLDAYDRTAATLDALVNRKLDKFLTVSAGVSGTQEHVSQEGVGRDYSFVGLPIGVKYDTTGSLLAPVHGVRVSATVTPTESFGGGVGSATYALIQATGSTYINLGAPGRSVLALRATIDASEGATQFGIPPDQRVYGGGSGTIRGYKYQYVGPQFADGRPQGGTALDAATIEFRQRFGKSYGAAVFVDGGQVSANGLPFTGAFRAGVGVGARYYTAIGPIRIDVAVPVIHQDNAGSFQLYIGIGEAF